MLQYFLECVWYDKSYNFGEKGLATHKSCPVTSSHSFNQWSKEPNVHPNLRHTVTDCFFFNDQKILKSVLCLYSYHSNNIVYKTLTY